MPKEGVLLKERNTLKKRQSVVRLGEKSPMKNIAKTPTKASKNSSERTLEITVEASQLLQQLYILGFIRDSDELLTVSFHNSKDAVDVKGNKKVGIPMTIKYIKKDAISS